MQFRYINNRPEHPLGEQKETVYLGKGWLKTAVVPLKNLSVDELDLPVKSFFVSFLFFKKISYFTQLSLLHSITIV